MKMKKALKITGLVLLWLFAIALLGIGWLTDTKWLQWIVIVPLALYFGGRAFQEHEDRKMRERAEMDERLRQIHEAALANNRILHMLLERLR